MELTRFRAGAKRKNPMKKKLPTLELNPRSDLRQLVLVPAICLLNFVIAMNVNGQSQLLKDINTQEDISTNEYSALTAAPDKVYFINNGNELWKTTGNEGGTVRVKAFQQVAHLLPFGSTLFFAANDGTGMELWKSTGTPRSTVKVREFMPGAGGGSPASFTPMNGIIYFVASTVTNGRELWRTDGTTQGTRLVKDIHPGKRGSDPAGLTDVNGVLYFSANDGKKGHELWKTDGTAQGTVIVKDIRPGAYLGSTPQQLTNVAGTLFFTAYEGTAGRELYKCGGSPETTVRLGDIRAGSASPNIAHLTAVNNTLFFSADDGIHGHELWKSDGTQSGTALLKDMTPGRAGSNGGDVFQHPMGNFKAVFGLLFYTGYASGTYYICKSDGTEAGTVPLHEAAHGISQPVPRFVPKGNHIYYFDAAEDETYYYENKLYRMNADGSNPVIVATLIQEDFYTTYDPELVELYSSLYFWGRRDASEGFKLFRSNGTPGHMVLIKDTQQANLGSDPYPMVSTNNGQVFFVAEKETFSPSLWRTDGTPGGTNELHQFDFLNSIVASGPVVYYSLGHSMDIWRSDGTPEGTAPVKIDAALPAAQNFIDVNGTVFFQTYNSGLWRTDGTAAGTIQLKTTDNVWQARAVRDLLLFTINKGGNVVELWRSNGTVTGTYRIFTFSGNKMSWARPMAVEENILYFVADDGISGNEVWRTDGTTTGTFMLADLNKTDDHMDGSYELDIRSMAVWNDHLYISAFDDTGQWALFRSNGAPGHAEKIRDITMITAMMATEHRLHFFSNVSNYQFGGANHWVTDGTASGTEMMSDQTFHNNLAFTVHDDILYFSDIINADLWRSDGTTCGTFPIDLGVHGAIPMERIGDLLVFAGRSDALGREPYAYDLAGAPVSPCGTPALDIPSTGANRMAGAPDAKLLAYPNPFTNGFRLLVPGADADVVQLEVFNSHGFPVEIPGGLRPNKEYRFGDDWEPGSYILHINISGTRSSFHVMKH